ncbi:spermatogenesis-associated protein 1 isoform X2 [Pogoniulus pusillus]|uniref:spermatogenesis-associated protein 1 isoform X2 n=1 Tax=Pogoniulus pusillus TaxID=488313 RepID=UPI0030B9274D
MSFSHMRPRTSQLVELHVFYVPEEVWNFKLNTVPIALASKFISAGFIRCINKYQHSRVSPHITLRVLREKLGEYLGGVTVADKFKFLKCVGKKLAVVKAKQETELELKSFAPPYALYPELYLLPEVEYFEDVYPLSSVTQQRQYFNAEDNRFGHGSRLFSLLQQKPPKSKQFLESIHSSHQPENQKVHNPMDQGEKESLPVLHTKHRQDYSNIVQEKHIKSREKDENRCSGSPLTPSHSNPAHWESGESGTVLQTSQQNHLSQDQEGPSTPKWNDKTRGNHLTLHVNQSDEQGQNNHTHENHITYRKDLTNTEKNDHQNDTKVRGSTIQDARILTIVEDQATEHAHKKPSLQQYRMKKSIADPGEKWDKQAGERKQNHLTHPKESILPPSPPFPAFSLNSAQGPAMQAAKSKMAEQLQQMKKDRRHMEKTRKELMKKAKAILEQSKLRRYQVREEWKKKYFETKKATVSLEGALSKLQQEVELYHQKLLKQLEARGSRNRPNNMTDSKHDCVPFSAFSVVWPGLPTQLCGVRPGTWTLVCRQLHTWAGRGLQQGLRDERLQNYTVIRITTVQHELDQLRMKLDDTKMKLIIEIKLLKLLVLLQMRKQAASDLRALRAELTQKKIHSALILQSRKAGIEDDTTLTL